MYIYIVYLSRWFPKKLTIQLTRTLAHLRAPLPAKQRFFAAHSWWRTRGSCPPHWPCSCLPIQPTAPRDRPSGSCPSTWPSPGGRGARENMGKSLGNHAEAPGKRMEKRWEKDIHMQPKAPLLGRMLIFRRIKWDGRKQHGDVGTLMRIKLRCC